MLSKFSVKKPYTVFVGVVLVIILGIVSFTKMTTDLFPNISLPYIIVITTYPGASPESVENEVTKNIEASMETVSNIESVSSVSAENYSLVICEFAQTANMDSISLEIRENLDQLTGYFPDSVGNPVIMKLNPNMLPVMIAAVSVEGMDRAEVSAYIEEQIVPEVESIEGVASVSTTGIINEQVNVVITQEKVDAINEQIRAGIDAQMKDAQKKLGDAEKSLKDAKKQMDSAQSQLDAGKQELQNKQNTTVNQLATTQTQLLTAKADLEAAKMNYTSRKATIEGYVTTIEKTQKEKDDLNTLLPTLTLGSPEYIQAMTDIAIKQATIDSLTTALDHATEGMGATIYLSNMTAALTTINTQITTIDASLDQLNQGNLQAAIQFSNAASELSLQQNNLNSAKAEIEAGLDEIENSKEQMKEATGEAYGAADAKEILSVDTISALLTAQNFSYPAGYITEEGTSYLVRVGDKPDDVKSLSKLPLMDMHIEDMDIITLADAADVFYTDNSKEVYAKMNGANSVMLNIQKQTDYSTGDVSDKLNEEFEKLKQQHEGLELVALMDQGIYIDLVMDSIFESIIVGAALAIIILIVFLRDIRPTFVIAVSIPISLVATIVCMYFSGVTLNVISLSGLALGIGMLVDNSIVVIENIYRLRSEGMSITEAAKEGAKEVAGAIIASTLTTVCVFLPIVFTEGLTRQLFVDLGLTIGYSLLASLVIAMTVVPAMASKTLTKVKEQKEGRFYGKVLNVYEKILRVSLKYKVVVFIFTLVLLVVSAAASISRGTVFMSSMESTQISVTVTLDEEATLEETAEITDKVMEQISTIDGIIDVGAMMASSGYGSLLGASSDVTNQTSIYITLEEKKELSNEEIADKILELTKDLDAEIAVETSGMDMTAMFGEGVSVDIKGRDLDVLQKIAGEIAEILENTEGTVEVSDGMEEVTDELRIIIDREKAIEHGLTVAQVYTGVAEKLSAASQATTLNGAEKDYAVYVESEENTTLTREALESITVEGTDADGKKVDVPLSDIASFESAKGFSSINRSEQSRYVTVSAAIAEGYNVGLVSADIEEQLEKYDMPAGYSYKMGGENEATMEAMGQLVLMLVLAIAFMYLIMVAQFQSLLSPFIILFTIPLAFTGGFAALYLTGTEVSVIAMIGFVMLSGIIVNNGIVIIDYMNQLREHGMSKVEAIVDAGRTRLRPVLMTASTTIFAMMGMVFSQDMGASMAKPMALVTIGGLTYGTLLTLIVVPCVYDVFIKKDKKDTSELKLEISED